MMRLLYQCNVNSQENSRGLSTTEMKDKHLKQKIQGGAT
jgi:hypothetical protein